MAVENKFITKGECSSRHRWQASMYGTLFSLIAVFLALIVYASSQVSEANDNYNRIAKDVNESQNRVQVLSSDLDKYKESNRIFNNAILEKIEEIKISLKDQRNEQRALLEKILEVQLIVARQSGYPIKEN